MSFGIPELLIILFIIVLLFGTRKIKGLGGDLGGALKSFRVAMRDSDGIESAPDLNEGRIIEGQTEADAGSNASANSGAESIHEQIKKSKQDRAKAEAEHSGSENP